MLILAPSLLSADFANLTSDIKNIEKGGARYLHLDVMDGDFVPNISFGVPVIKKIRKITNLFFDVHMMVQNPERYFESFKNSGADLINFHSEAVQSSKNAVKQIKDLGVKAGITIKPNTPVDDILGVLPDVDLVLVMSVEPGFGGQKFMPNVLEKVRILANLKKENNYTYEIQMDGGISVSNVRECIEAGATNFVAGSSVFAMEDQEQAARAFIEIFKEYEK